MVLRRQSSPKSATHCLLIIDNGPLCFLMTASSNLFQVLFRVCEVNEQCWLLINLLHPFVMKIVIYQQINIISIYFVTGICNFVKKVLCLLNNCHIQISAERDPMFKCSRCSCKGLSYTKKNFIIVFREKKLFASNG